MLVDLMSGELITRIPFERWYRGFTSRLTNAEIGAIKIKLNSLINNTEVQTAGWMPGSGWAGTVYEPIYENAARRDYKASALFFGLMVYEVFMERPERWSSGRFEKNGLPIGSRTYFCIR